MKTFLSLVKSQGHPGLPKVKRWKVYFALHFNLALKEYMKNIKSYEAN